MELVAADGTLAWYWRAGLWGQRQGPASAEGSVDCPLRFPGQYHDSETGWNYNLFRYYDPENARYVTPDPMGLAPAPNHYAYVDNPLGWTDPLGLITYDQAKKVADGVNQRAVDGATKRKAGPPPPAGNGYHGHMDQNIEEEILKNPDAVYYSTGTGDRVIFRKGDDIVVMDGKGATKGHIVTSYGPSGVAGPTGVKAYPHLNLKETDPGPPITHDMLINGQVPNGKGGFLAPAVQVGFP
ncbi:MAG: RHS repeat-associated core domain-containing protein, partial [Catenulispora sp.]|nr:RHS repeat-associated core domain-containing protein [Catenulispora sp.]